MNILAWLKAPSPAATRRPLPLGRGEGRNDAAAASPLPLAERSAAKPTGEVALLERHCAIWNDIARALEAKPKGAK